MRLISFELFLFVLIFRFGTTLLLHTFGLESSILLEGRPLLALYLLLIGTLVCFYVCLKLTATLYDFCLLFFGFFFSLLFSSLIVFT